MTRDWPIEWPGWNVVLGGLLLSGLLAGCGGDTGPQKPQGDATVTITYGGAPVTAGRVDLVNDQTGEGGGAELDENGQATLSGVTQGSYTVTVVPPPPENPAPIPGQPAPVEKQYANIPKKFRQAATSPLRADVKDEAAEYSFDLKE